MLDSAKCIAEMILAEKMKNNGIVPWGYALKLLKEGRKTFPALSRRTINNYNIWLEKEKKIGCTICVDNFSNDISSLTSPNVGTVTNIRTISNNNDDDGDATEDASHSDSNSNNSNSDSSNSDAENQRLNFVGGRPKGSTIASSLDLKSRVNLAIEDAVKEFREAQAKSKITNERLRRGAFTEIISNTKDKYGLGDNITINAGSIRQ
jgi:hypothetical protein